VLFLYPTRATATEGFKDYVSWAPESGGALMHGTADYDLDGMFPSEDSRYAKSFATDPRLFALRFWSKRVFSATVDQFLAFMSYSYGPACLLPVLADSVIVVDEVHSFDRSMFSALLGFAKAFDVPVLCMTATLPEPRQLQLAEAGFKLANPRPDDLQTIAGTPRYQVVRTTEDKVVDHIRDALALGKRVLWVVNQVSRALAAVRSLATDFDESDLEQATLRGLNGVRLYCYHSRFTLNNRIDRHRGVVSAIRVGQAAVVAVTTQVCEMSLDIDADVLVTEECPITSLIQRMGRCCRDNRFAQQGRVGEVLIYKPAKECVYTTDDLAGVSEFLGFLTERGRVSQTDLEVGLERFGSPTTEVLKLNSFLDSGPYAVAREDAFREVDEFAVPAVLRCDVDAYLDSAASKKAGFILPVPKSAKPTADSRLPRYLSVADERYYHAGSGFWDRALR
jgi:CRISPR-associated endonuclease/helicase Cas3